MREERRRYGPHSESDGLAGSPPSGSRLRGKKLPQGITISSPLGTRPGAVPFDAAQGAGAGLSLLTGTVTARRAEFRLETRPKSSERFVEVFRHLRGVCVVRERENRPCMGRTGRPKSGRKRKKGENDASQYYCSIACVWL